MAKKGISAGVVTHPTPGPEFRKLCRGNGSILRDFKLRDESSLCIVADAVGITENNTTRRFGIVQVLGSERQAEVE